MEERAIVLVSSLSTDQIQIVNSRRIEDALKGKNMSYDRVDGAMPENKDLRDKLFGISGQRGKYPQCFIQRGDECRFVGMWDEIESLLDCDALPADVLSANPTIPTFSKVRMTNISWCPLKLS